MKIKVRLRLGDLEAQSYKDAEIMLDAVFGFIDESDDNEEIDALLDKARDLIGEVQTVLDELNDLGFRDEEAKALAADKNNVD